MLKSATWDIEPQWQQSEFATEVNNLGKAFEDYQHPVSLSSQSRVFRYTQATGDTFFIKQYLRTKGISAWFGYTRCETEVRNIKWFSSQGIKCGPLVAYGIEKQYFRIQRGVLVTANIENSRDLQQTAEQAPGLFRNRQWRIKLINQVADVASKLHRHNFCHNDFHWRNILVTQDEVQPQIYLIDCPFGRRYTWPLLNYRKIKDLASLDELARQYLSKTDRLRFFKRYREIDHLSRRDKKMIRTMLRRYAS